MRFATKSALLIALIAGLLSYAKFDHCRTNGWGGTGTYVHACYSDLPALYLERKLNTKQWPYKDGKDSVEYPPGVAIVMWATSFAVNHDYNQYRAYFDINALLIFILFIQYCPNLFKITYLLYFFIFIFRITVNQHNRYNYLVTLFGSCESSS